MAGINGYLEVEIRGTNAVGIVHPPQPGGKGINIAETEAYLRSHGINDFDKTSLRSSLMKGEDKEIDLGPCDGYNFSESMTFKVSLDKMRCTARFLPPSVGGNLMNAQDILGELSSKNIIYGISQKAIMDFMSDRKYATDYVIAMGNPPTFGKDAKIEYFFNINPNLAPLHHDDGTVDYHELNMINNIEEGDLLARLIPAEPGRPGKDVYGREIHTRTVKNMHLKFGKNIRISDDRTAIYSEVRGHVTLVDGTVFVSDVYEIPNDVDNSTGNIEFSGNVHVKGNVRGGFSIIASGDVIVDGVVENSLIQAGGQVVVKHGIHGMNKGIIDARGNVITQFVENATIYSGGYVETGSIIYSDVNASTDVIVKSHEGFILGGSVRAGRKVEANSLGSQMGAHTRVEIGIAPEKKEKYLRLQRDIQAKNAKIEKLTPIINTYQKYVEEGRVLDEKNITYMNQIMDELHLCRQQLQSDRETYNALHQELLNSQHAKLSVTRNVYPGVTVVISDSSIEVKEMRSFCMFTRDGNRVKVSRM